MPKTIDNYRYDLISNILHSACQDDVRSVINTAIGQLHEHKVDPHIIGRFIDKNIQYLNGLNALDYDFHQWSNIKMARIQFNQLKRGTLLNLTTNN